MVPPLLPKRSGGPRAPAELGVVPGGAGRIRPRHVGDRSQPGTRMSHFDNGIFGAVLSLLCGASHPALSTRAGAGSGPDSRIRAPPRGPPAGPGAPGTGLTRGVAPLDGACPPAGAPRTGAGGPVPAPSGRGGRLQAGIRMCGSPRAGAGGILHRTFMSRGAHRPVRGGPGRGEELRGVGAGRGPAPMSAPAPPPRVPAAARLRPPRSAGRGRPAAAAVRVRPPRPRRRRRWRAPRWSPPGTGAGRR